MMRPGTYRIGIMALIAIVLELFTWALMLGIWWYVDREVPAFRFNEPGALWAMLIGPVMVILFLLDMAWRNRAMSRFASESTLVRMVPGISSGRSLLRFLLVRHGLGFVVLALAAPQFGSRPNTVRSEGIDVVVAIDVSNSMLCEDLIPNRMEVARRAMAQVIERMQGDRLGIVVFAGNSFVQLPITADRSAAKMFLAGVGPGNVATQGTAIGDAIGLAAECFDMKNGSSKAIVVITDGENFEDDAEGAARAAAADKILVYTVGMGSVQGGPIPIRRNGQMLGFKKDSNGTTVITKLNEGMLRAIAEAGGGSYSRATSSSTGMDQIISDLKALQKTEVGTYQYTAHEDQYQYPLALGMLLIALSFSFGTRSWGVRNLSIER
ncbi:MAG: VWA domain-containing protein [Flavobacteriales bacterium]|nr:VWA domain-containing protein [Flavobacteriales bacterium]